MPADRAPGKSHRSSSLIEPLENRLLMHRVNGSQTFEYLAGDDETIVRVVVKNADVEFVFAQVDKQTNDLTLRTGFITPPGEDDEERPGRDLFAVYVRTSDVDSYISIAAVPALDDEDRPMLPFVESIGELRVRGAQDGDLIAVGAPADTGAVLLGAKTRDLEDSDVEDEDNIPIISKVLDGDDRIGGLVADDGVVHAGLTVARDNDFGRFLFGGTVLGRVEFTASVETFYAGWLLTGDATGIFELEDQAVNFFVEGDIRNLIVKSSIGTNADALNTEPQYLSGFNLKARGRIGQVRAFDSIAGQVYAQHRDDAPQTVGQVESEDRRLTEKSFTVFQDGWLGPDAPFRNDTFATPEFLGSFANSDGENIARVTGQLQNSEEMQDVADYYGIALLAGQEITVGIDYAYFETFDGPRFIDGALNIGVFDPDGRLVATDYDAVQQKISFKTDRPGVHRIAIAVAGDADFVAGGEFETEEIVLNYRFRALGVGDLAIGAVAANVGIFDRAGNSVRAGNGDVGAIYAGGGITAQQFFAESNFLVQRGNLRSIEAGTIGVLSGERFGFDPMIDVPRGSVGLVRSTNAAGVLVFNDNGFSDNAPAIGGDYQLVESASNLHARLVANGNIGVIRAAQIATQNDRAFFKVNADENGPAGVIDLIDVAGNLGTLEAGGPAIETGPGGNVRYINVGGEVFQDRFFGDGSGFETEFADGERVDLTDDSGASFRLTPVPRTFNPNFDPSNPFSPRFILPGALTVATYGIRDKGGVVVLNVSSTRGVQVDSSGGNVEIAQIEANGTGTAIIDRIILQPGQTILDDPERELQLSLALSSRALDVLLRGSGAVDVLNVTGGQFTSIINSTQGEIVSADITSVGEMRARTLGLAKSSTGAAVNPLSQKSNVYPFLDQRNAIQISGNAIEIAADRGLGNLIVGGIVQRLEANADGANSSNVFEGINAPVQVTGELRDVSIGEGILYSGAGNVSAAGIYAQDDIGMIRGNSADIRGDIVSNTAIEGIRLNNGSIINADIASMDDFADSRQFFTDFHSINSVRGSFSDPFYEIGSIEITGNGGIIGSVIRAFDIGPTSVIGGFGVLQSTFETPGLGQVGVITADGYGVRNVIVDGGTNFAGIRTLGTGGSSSVTNYSKSVRQSERTNTDEFFGRSPSNHTDLHVFLGTSEERPTIKNVTKTGVIENIAVLFSRNIGFIDAHVVRGNTVINGANSIDSFVVRNGVNRLSVRTGRIRELRIGGNTRNADIRLAGPLEQGIITGDLDAASNITATGIDGVISNLSITGDMIGSVRASVGIDTLAIGGSMTGPLKIDGTTRDATALRQLTVGRDLTGDVNILGKVKKVQVGRDFGRGNTAAVITGELEELIVGRHFDASLRVRRDVGKLSVDNSILSGTVITVDDDMGALIVGDDVQAGAVITIAGTLGSRSIGGDVDGDIIVG